MNQNINNHNGKEIHKDQMQKNENKVGDPKPVDRDRVKKKSTNKQREIHPVGPKKTPVNINKDINKPAKGQAKSHVIKPGDKEKRIPLVETPVKKNSRLDVNSAQVPTNGKSFTTQDSVPKRTADVSQTYKSDHTDFRVSPSARIYFFLIATILFIGWIITFFVYDFGANSHILLALAVIVTVLSFLQGREK